MRRDEKVTIAKAQGCTTSTLDPHISSQIDEGVRTKT